MKLIKRITSLPPITFAAAMLVIYFLPFLISGESSNITIHDNLDNNVAQYTALSKEGKILALNPNQQVDFMFSGLPRMFFLSGLNFQAILFIIFTPFIAYLLNFVLVHTIGFAGMYLLLKNHVLKEKEDETLVALVSLFFALVPFYTIHGLSVAGTPLVLFAFINLLESRKIKLSFCLLIAFPFYSSLLLIGIFIIVTATMFAIYHYLVMERIPKKFLIGLCMLTGTYLLPNYQLIYQFFFSNIQSHRAELVAEPYDFVSVVDHAFKNFTELQYHVSQPVGFVFVLALIACVLGISTRNEKTGKLLSLLSLAFGIAFVQSLSSWEMLDPLWKAAPITLSFQWNRFYFLSPLVWALSLAYSLVIIIQSTHFLRMRFLILTTITCFQIYHLWKYNLDFRETTYNLFADHKQGWSFQNFYDNALFNEVKDFIGMPQDSYKVVNLGIYPAVVQANGFRTIDGYLSNYPLTYKHHFRKVMERELNKSGDLRKYFDEFGSRCYLFSNELRFNFTADKFQNSQVNDLQFDFDAGPQVDYLMSSVNISSPAALNLQLLKIFERDNSRWRIFLYKIRHEGKSDDDHNTQIRLRLQSPTGDTIRVSYQQEALNGYRKDQSISLYAGEQTPRTMTFKIPDTVSIKSLRFDFGQEIIRQQLKIEKVEIAKGDKVVPVLSKELVLDSMPALRDFRTSFSLRFDDSAVYRFNRIRRGVSARQSSGSITWNKSTNIRIEGERQYRKFGNVDDWNEEVYSSEGYVKNVYCSATVLNTSAPSVEVAFGLNQDPTTNSSYASIDYAWIFSDERECRIYEAGTWISSHGNWTKDTVLTIVYDGNFVKYYKDGIVMRCIKRESGTPFYFDSSYFYSQTSGLKNIEFGLYE